MNPSPAPPPARPAAWWTNAAAWWALAAAAGLWCGCTVTRENYATLSTFFDGVPNPDAPGRPGADAGDKSLAPSVLVHRPFAEEKCEACHKTQYRPTRNDPSACLACHENLTAKHAWTHGAVAGGACLWCHAPHESARKWLLRSPDRKLCMQCHSATMMNGSVVPAHADPKTGCLECHFGHGGDSPLMLKPGASATTIPAPISTDLPPTPIPSHIPTPTPTPAPPSGK